MGSSEDGSVEVGQRGGGHGAVCEWVVGWLVVDVRAIVNEWEEEDDEIVMWCSPLLGKITQRQVAS
jgi:hypothetical protein